MQQRKVLMPYGRRRCMEQKWACNFNSALAGIIQRDKADRHVMLKSEFRRKLMRDLNIKYKGPSGEGLWSSVDGLQPILD